MNCTIIVGNWCVNNAAVTLATVLATTVAYSSALFLTVLAAMTYRHFFMLQVQTSFNLKKTSYESSTVAQIAERVEPNTVLWAFHTIQPSSFKLLVNILLMQYSVYDVRHLTSSWGI